MFTEAYKERILEKYMAISQLVRNYEELYGIEDIWTSEQRAAHTRSANALRITYLKVQRYWKIAWFN